MNKKNKILIFSIAYEPFMSGAEIAWREITNRLPEFEFDMITARVDSRLPTFQKIGRINVHRVGFGRKFDTIILPITAFLKALSLHKKNFYSLIIGLIYNQASLAAAFFKFFYPKIPFLLNIQDGDTEEYIEQKTKYIKFLTKYIYLLSDHITVLANFLKERTKKNGAKSPVDIIPNGVDLKIFTGALSPVELQELKRNLGFKDSDKVIIHTGRLNYKNALGDLILALKFLDNNYKLLLIGQGKEKINLKKIVADFGFESRIKFLPFMPHAEMVKYLRFSDVFCRPSLQEGLGSSFLEAMAAGVPVIATPVGGIPDFIKNKETGLFCEVGNPKSIANKIKLILDDNEMRLKVIENSKKLIKEKYDWNLIARRYFDLFQKLTNNIK